MWSAAFSPSMIVGAFRLPLVMRGNTELSTTRSPSTPITRHSGSTTASGSDAAPMRALPQGWKALSAWSRMKASIASSPWTAAPGWISCRT